MSTKRYLIVNADDFGHSSAVNRGVIHAYEHGIVTSASLMVRWPAAGEAAEYARNHPSVSLGLHIDFGEWVYRDENWVPVYNVVLLDDAMALRNEVSHQLAVFRTLTGKTPAISILTNTRIFASQRAL